MIGLDLEKPEGARLTLTERKAARLERRRTREGVKAEREYREGKLQRTLTSVLSAVTGNNDSVPLEVLEQQVKYLSRFNIHIGFSSLQEISED